MRKWALISVLLAGLAAAGFAMISREGEPGHNTTISGTLSCAACKIAGSPNHKCSTQCCMECIAGGDSVVLEDDRGNLFLMISKDKGKPVVTRQNGDLLGIRVVVNGMSVERGGLRGIYVQSITGAPR